MIKKFEQFIKENYQPTQFDFDTFEYKNLDKYVLRELSDFNKDCFHKILYQNVLYMAANAIISCNKENTLNKYKESIIEDIAEILYEKYDESESLYNIFYKVFDTMPTQGANAVWDKCFRISEYVFEDLCEYFNISF